MTASAPQAITPTPMQADMQRVPLDHDLIACGGRGLSHVAVVVVHRLGLAWFESQVPQ